MYNRKASRPNRRKYERLIGTFIDDLYVVDVMRNGKKSNFIIRCKCGREFISRVDHIINHKTIRCHSCRTPFNFKHNSQLRRTFASWSGCKQRCENKQCKDYSKYGARGIKLCKEWQTFKSFLNDMGLRPNGMSLDRIDVNGDYCKENCRWATPLQQANNRTNTIYIVIDGIKDTLSNYSRNLKIPRHRLIAKYCK